MSAPSLAVLLWKISCPWDSKINFQSRLFLVHATMRDCYAILPDANKMNTWWLQYFLWSWRPFISFDGRWGKDTVDTHHRDLAQDHLHRWARVKETHNHDLRIENTKIKPNVAIRWYFTSLIIIVGPSCDTITGITLTFPPQPKWVHSGIIRGGTCAVHCGIVRWC